MYGMQIKWHFTAQTCQLEISHTCT